MHGEKSLRLTRLNSLGLAFRWRRWCCSQNTWELVIFSPVVTQFRNRWRLANQNLDAQCGLVQTLDVLRWWVIE
jgi:hypothetical protein